MSNSSSRIPLRRSTRLLGKPRRSHRLLGKPAVIVKQRIKSSIRKPSERDDDLFAGPATYVTSGGSNIEQYSRSRRKSASATFQRKYIYDDTIDERVYINSSGDTCSWIDRSAGCMWVAVQGMDTICVAIRETLDMDRYPGWSDSMFRRFFSLNVVSEIEDITFSTGDSRQTLDKHVTKPFGVVSVIQSTTTNGQERGDEASDALQYLKKRFESGLAFNHIETIQTAISALQHVCNQELKANDIWVCVLDWESEYHLQREQLEEHLAVINNKTVQPSSPLSPSCIASAPCSSDNAATTSSPRNVNNSPVSDVQHVTIANLDLQKPLSCSPNL